MVCPLSIFCALIVFRSSVFLHVFVLLPYVVLWLLSYGQNCIGVSVLAYALFVFVVTVQGILMYDGAAHKGLDPKVGRSSETSRVRGGGGEEWSMSKERE